jgi:hypothetical protein
MQPVNIVHNDELEGVATVHLELSMSANMCDGRCSWVRGSLCAGVPILCGYAVKELASLFVARVSSGSRCQGAP